MKNLLSLLEDNPIIGGVKDNKGLDEVLRSDCNVVFVLYGNILTISDIIDKVKNSGKLAFVHVDLLEGTSHKDVVIEYIKEKTKADGIISTKAHMIQVAREYGLFTVHRFFLVDSMSFYSLEKQISHSKPDCIEIMPGCMPKVLGWVVDLVDVPIIAGGLVCAKDDVVNALKAGATAISTTNMGVWKV
ncbi:glycerol-3-phosphate responsive antiterminator [Vallitalea okinawensis]|uniref:glycerol-3-phosphate responsive antiterminator n=1 Tax=Vallitalea okinawensis TaxID=2078660 RepID=UPI000CFC218D|nr:glycerol-3-phosphate responsive antiterminator [Vallitalea okinawensis]